MTARDWVCAGECGQHEVGLSVPNGWLTLTIRKSVHDMSGPKMLRESPIDAMSGVYCSYDCVSLRADRVARTRRFSVDVDTLRGSIGLEDLVIDE